MNSKINNPYKFLRTNKKISNRTVLAAMTNKQSHDNGILSDDEIKWLYERAKGGFGIITTAATNVSKEAKAWNGEFGVYDDIHLPQLKKLTTKIHKTKSLIFAQLFHGGLKSPQKITGETPISASIIDCKESFSGKSKSASEKDIVKIINDFKNAAVRCSNAGFDGIELHGAHGYLISQFLGFKTNLRNDNWGGDLMGRSQLLLNIIKSIKQNVPDNFIVGVRLSPEIESIGINLNDTIRLIGILRNMNLDFIHISCWDVFAKPQTIHNQSKTLTQIITESYDSLPTIISTGGVWSSSDANKLLMQGCDLVGVGRVAIAHPEWPKKIKDENYNPKKPPFNFKKLKKAKLNDTFINYMRNWNNFVEN